MELKEFLSFKNVAVVGDTINEDKYAYLIKNTLIDLDYNVYPIYKEIKDINDVEVIDYIDLCINPVKGLEILKSCKRPYKAVLIQPGAGSEELEEYLNSINVPFVHGCILKAISMYK